MRHALEVLEFERVLERLAARCETELGACLARAVSPSTEVAEVRRRLELAGEACALLDGPAPPSLGLVRDLRKPVRLAGRGATLGGQELFQIGQALEAMRAFRQFVLTRKTDHPMLAAMAENLPDAKGLESRLHASLESDGTVRDSASPELARVRSRKSTVAHRLVEKIQSYTVRFREFLSDPIYTTRDGRYVVPVKAEHRGKIRGIVHDTSSSGQTLFVEPEDVLQLGNTLRELEAAEREETQRVLSKLSAEVGRMAVDLEAALDVAGRIDASLAVARLAFDERACMPELAEGHGIELSRARHPLLDPDTVVPIDIEVGFDGDGLLITGPNTGGKTIAIKTVGLLALMVQSGLLPPAERCRIGPFTQFWADIGDEQSLQQSLSTFSAHIRNIVEALRNLRSGALVLLDELGAGTDPAEGAALAKAILLKLQEGGAKVVASTHYGELKAFAYNTPGFQNAAMEFDAKSLRPTYRLILGAPGASHALKIAGRYGLPKDVVEQARASLTSEQQDIARMLEKLELAQRQARIAQSEADRRTAELRKAEAMATRKLAEAQEIRRSAHAEAREEIERVLREIRRQAADIFEELKRDADPRRLQQARERLRTLQEEGEKAASRFRSDEPEPTAADLIAPGMLVKVEGYTQVGTVLTEPRADTVQVQLGAIKMNVPLSRLRPVEAASRPATKARANLQLSRALQASTEIHLRQMRAEDAQRELEKFLDDAVLAGLDQVRIVHGKGEGVLRKVTHEVLRRHPHVRSWGYADPAAGGQGVTVARFQ
ncbi:MAG: endonuclease MutS2 [Fimbriimonadales bacterium]|nr:endonuclease MutS2 [Fimbriimonadales bacterium]